MKGKLSLSLKVRKFTCEAESVFGMDYPGQAVHLHRGCG